MQKRFPKEIDKIMMQIQLATIEKNGMKAAIKSAILHITEEEIKYSIEYLKSVRNKNIDFNDLEAMFVNSPSDILIEDKKEIANFMEYALSCMEEANN